MKTRYLLFVICMLHFVSYAMEPDNFECAVTLIGSKDCGEYGKLNPLEAYRHMSVAFQLDSKEKTDLLKKYKKIIVLSPTIHPMLLIELIMQSNNGKILTEFTHDPKKLKQITQFMKDTYSDRLRIQTHFPLTIIQESKRHNCCQEIKNIILNRKTEKLNIKLMCSIIEYFDFFIKNNINDKVLISEYIEMIDPETNEELFHVHADIHGLTLDFKQPEKSKTELDKRYLLLEFKEKDVTLLFDNALENNDETKRLNKIKNTFNANFGQLFNQLENYDRVVFYQKDNNNTLTMFCIITKTLNCNPADFKFFIDRRTLSTYASVLKERAQSNNMQNIMHKAIAPFKPYENHCENRKALKKIKKELAHKRQKKTI